MDHDLELMRGVMSGPPFLQARVAEFFVQARRSRRRRNRNSNRL